MARGCLDSDRATLPAPPFGIPGAAVRPLCFGRDIAEITHRSRRWPVRPTPLFHWSPRAGKHHPPATIPGPTHAAEASAFHPPPAAKGRALGYRQTFEETAPAERDKKTVLHPAHDFECSSPA